MKLRTCVAPQGRFVYGIHEPAFSVANLREKDYLTELGKFVDQGPIHNRANFPPDAVSEPHADAIFEIPNPLAFRGTTYIGKAWADAKACDPGSIRLPETRSASFLQTLREWLGQDSSRDPLNFIENLPDAVLLALATTSTDPEELSLLARSCCRMIMDPGGKHPKGLYYTKESSGRIRPMVERHALFEALANNPFLPDDYKQVMVLTPGTQGNSQIVGEWRKTTGDSQSQLHSHVFEYLRTNSYIPWGHYAANMAHDAIRYRAQDLTPEDMHGMRHLYYQRTYVRLAEELGMGVPARRRPLTADELETLRRGVCHRLFAEDNPPMLTFDGTLWGWNFGFDYSPSNYRLHASHQQIHQQFALIPSQMTEAGQSGTKELSTYACGDMVTEFIGAYERQNRVPFFEAYLKAVLSNRRMDNDHTAPSSLIVHRDDLVILFVPKAQTSQWELQLMPLAPVGNILEAGTDLRRALDRAILMAVQTLEKMGARMITIIEYAKRLTATRDNQHLIYAFLPRLPESPGAFSEAQLRWIIGHYPEDFAAACRARLDE
jgi:hypothetical protein